MNGMLALLNLQLICALNISGFLISHAYFYYLHAPVLNRANFSSSFSCFAVQFLHFSIRHVLLLVHRE